MPRIVIYSHDTYGLGHLRRALNLAQAFAARHPNLQGVLLTGSPWAHLFSVPSCFTTVNLPPVVKTGVNRYASRGGDEQLEDRVARRRDQIVQSIGVAAPDLIVVDNVPGGLCGEMLPALKAARSLYGSRCVLALRDVLDDDRAINREWQRRGATEVIDSLYDEVWVFGDQQAHRHLIDNGPLQEVQVPIRCCGLIATSREESTPAVRPIKPQQVLVTGGGGGDANRLVTCYLQMLLQHPFSGATTISLGPDFPIEELGTVASGTSVKRFIPDLASHIAEADLVVSMAGYNTVAEVLASGTRAILVPRVRPRREQWVRAQALLRKDRVSVIHPDDLTPQRLQQEMERTLSEPTSDPVPAIGGANACRWAEHLMRPSLKLGVA